jgi:hypothetical protein
MLKRYELLFFVSFLGQIIYAQHDHAANPGTANSAAFNEIKSLVGNWEGTYQWIGQSARGEMGAKYYLTGNGTTVIEDLIQSGNIIMTSAYHLDGNDVRVTHYCAAGNQPRLKADTPSTNDKSIRFKFVDITNLKEPGSGHVKAIELKFPEKDKLVIIFTFTTSGRESIEQIELTRAS